MNKFALSLLGLTAIMSVTGCGATNSATGGDTVEGYVVPAESLTLNIRSVSLLVGEKANIEAKIKPFAAWNTKLTYKSSKSGVASVNAKGEVVAKGSGHATITVTAANFVDQEKTPKLISTVEVYVYKQADTSKKRSLLSEMRKYQSEHCSEMPDNIILYDYRVYDLICQGKSQDRTDERQAYVNSRSRGLMHYNSTEYGINVTDGGESVMEYGYICQTKDSYASYMYHYNDNEKNVFYIASEFNKGKATRYETMQSILDCYFSVSNDYFTGAYEDIYSTDWFNDFGRYGSLVNKFGSYNKNGDFCISYTLHQTIDDGEFDEEDECRWATQLPAGIEYRSVEDMTYTWVNGWLTNMSYKSSKVFEMDGKPYQYDVSLNQTFVIASDAEIDPYVPEDTGWNNVEYWYEI